MWKYKQYLIMNLLLVKRKMLSVMVIQKHTARVIMTLAMLTKMMIFSSVVGIRKVSLHMTKLIKIIVFIMSINT